MFSNWSNQRAVPLAQKEIYSSLFLLLSLKYYRIFAKAGCDMLPFSDLQSTFSNVLFKKRAWLCGSGPKKKKKKNMCFYVVTCIENCFISMLRYSAEISMSVGFILY